MQKERDGDAEMLLLEGGGGQQDEDRGGGGIKHDNYYKAERLDKCRELNGRQSLENECGVRNNGGR